MHSVAGTLREHRRDAFKNKGIKENVSCVYEKTHSPLLSLFLFQMQKKQKGQERFGRHHNTEVTFCAIVEVLLFFSYCLAHIRNEIKTMLMTREGQSLCWDGWLFERKYVYLCTLPHCFENKTKPTLFTLTISFSESNLQPAWDLQNVSSNLSHLTLPSNQESCYITEVTEAWYQI